MAAKFVIVGDWLAEEVGGCTCGQPAGPEYGCTPECGLEPVITLAELEEVLRARTGS